MTVEIGTRFHYHHADSNPLWRGYDWNGIRDSSPAAIEHMYQIAKKVARLYRPKVRAVQ